MEPVLQSVLDGFMGRWRLDDVAAKQLKAVNMMSPAVCLRVMHDYNPPTSMTSMTTSRHSSVTTRARSKTLHSVSP